MRRALWRLFLTISLAVGPYGFLRGAAGRVPVSAVSIMQRCLENSFYGLDLAKTRNLRKEFPLKEVVSFFHCKTCLGDRFLEKSLTSPLLIYTGDAEGDADCVLRSRRHAIKSIVEDGILRSELQNFLTSACEGEMVIDSLLKEGSRELSVFKLAKDPESSFFTKIWSKAAASMICSPLAHATLVLVGLWSVYAMPGAIKSGIRNSFDWIASSKNIFDKAFGYSILIGQPILSVWSMCNSIIFNLDYLFKKPQDQRRALHEVSRFIDAATRMEALLKQHGIKTQFSINKIKSKDCLQLINTLKRSPYTNKEQRVFNGFGVFATFYKFFKAVGQLDELFCFVGEVDALCSIATKMSEGQKALEEDEKGAAQANFCFARFVEGDRPRIIAENSWNLFVKKKPVKNSLYITKNSIITGPSSGGKTTFMKILWENILFAQTFGFATGSKFECTPFSHIYSYFSKSDNPEKGQSLFQAEVSHCIQGVKALQSAKEKNSKAFVIIDEPLTGTMPSEGGMCAREMMKKICKLYDKDGLFVCSTHYPELTELAREGLCENYCVMHPVARGTPGSSNNYRLLRGVNINYAVGTLAIVKKLFAKLHSSPQTK